MKVMGPKNHVYPRIFGLDFLHDMFLLHHATTHANHTPTLLGFQLLPLSQGSEEALVRIVSNATCINDKYLGLFWYFHFLISQLIQHARHGFRIMFVHLTTKGFNVITILDIHSIIHVSCHVASAHLPHAWRPFPGTLPDR